MQAYDDVTYTVTITQREHCGLDLTVTATDDEDELLLLVFREARRGDDLWHVLTALAGAIRLDLRERLDVT